MSISFLQIFSKPDSHGLGVVARSLLLLVCILRVSVCRLCPCFLPGCWAAGDDRLLHHHGLPCPSHPRSPGGCNIQASRRSPVASPTGRTCAFWTSPPWSWLYAKLGSHWTHRDTCLHGSLSIRSFLLLTLWTVTHPHLRLPLGCHLYVLWVFFFLPVFSFWELLSISLWFCRTVSDPAFPTGSRGTTVIPTCGPKTKKTADQRPQLESPGKL